MESFPGNPFLRPAFGFDPHLFMQAVPVTSLDRGVKNHGY
jgi:hypothetical protein